MSQDNFSGVSSPKLLHFDTRRVRGWAVGTVVVSFEKTRSSCPGEAGVIVHRHQLTDGVERYLILFASMGFDEWDANEMAKRLQIIPTPRATFLRGYNYVSLPELEADIAHGKLTTLFHQVNQIADRYFEVVHPQPGADPG